jgi:hypothetical protein
MAHHHCTRDDTWAAVETIADEGLAGERDAVATIAVLKRLLKLSFAGVLFDVADVEEILAEEAA